MLLWTRELVLKKTGYAVSSALVSEISPPDIEFDIMVLCRSITIETAEELARTVKANHPSTRIVCLSPSASTHDGCFDAVCDPTRGPVNLLAELARLRDTIPGTHGKRMQ